MMFKKYSSSKKKDIAPPAVANPPSKNPKIIRQEKQQNPFLINSSKALISL